MHLSVDGVDTSNAIAKLRAKGAVVGHSAKGWLFAHVFYLGHEKIVHRRRPT